MRFSFKYKGKKTVLDVEKCKTVLSRARGLMFRKTSKPLLLVFKKPTRQSIHSLFCPTFRAIWLNKGKIVDEKIVKPFSLSVRPKGLFTSLVEIPLKNNNKNKIVVENRKI